MELTALEAVAALTAAAAAGLLVPGPPRLARRLARTPPDPSTTGGPAAWLRLGPDTLAVRTRLLAAAAVLVLVATAVPALDRLGALVPWLLGSVAALVTFVVLGRLEPGAARRRRAQLVLDLPQALELLAAGLSAGLPLRSAAEAVVEVFDGPVGEELGNVATLVGLGTPDGEAWRGLRSHPQLGPVATDLARSVESGTTLVRALRRHARDARSARHAALEVAAKAVGVRSVLPMMLCFIPAFLLLGIVPTVVSALQNALPF